MDRYQLAIVKYGATQAEVKKLSARLAKLFMNCIVKHYGLDYNEDSKPCLFEGYKKVSRYREGMYDDVADYLCEEKDDCEFCLEADKLIQQRKLAKQSFGRAKAQITKLANRIKP